MAELTPNEKKIVDALIQLGAKDESHLKTADDVMRATKLPKGIVGSALTELTKKGVVKRVAREKAAGYYVISQ
ncbi:MAG: transcriptional regulator [archaeon]